MESPECDARVSGGFFFRLKHPAKAPPYRAALTHIWEGKPKLQGQDAAERLHTVSDVHDRAVGLGHDEFPPVAARR